MVVSVPLQKLYLYKLFLDEAGREKQFPISQLVDISSIMKKLKDKGKQVEGGFQFSDSKQEFSLDESKILKDLLTGLKTALPSEYEMIEQLKGIFK